MLRLWVYLTILFATFFAYQTNAQSTRSGWGATPYHDAGHGITFRVWAPNATSVFVPGQFNNWSTTANPLAKELINGVWNGVWSADIGTASPGQQYKYFINYSGGSVWKHDPRARYVTFSGASSGANDIIYDPTAFDWKGDSFAAATLDKLVIYEMHIGTFASRSGVSRFVAATDQLPYLKSLGVNTIEILPIAEFPGDNSWGYNPAQLFAVENGTYGGPDAFKTFVQACHAQGLAVLLDVVHNHYGPDDLDMWNFDGVAGAGPLGGGIYFNQINTNLQMTPYGYTRPNFSSAQVDSFVRDNFTMWLNEYHVDGFRWDTPGLMMNADNYGYISAAGDLIESINSMIHTNYPGKISISEDVYGLFGFDSAWDTTYPYALRDALAASTDANRDMDAVANLMQNNVRYGGAASTARVAFIESHDVVGDLNGGTRLPTAIDSSTPNSYRARKLATLGALVTMISSGVPMIFQGEEMLENQQFSSSRMVDWTKTNTYSGIFNFYRDLIGLRRNSRGVSTGLTSARCSILANDNTEKLIAVRRWSSLFTNADVVVVANFSGSQITSYPLGMPSSGPWYIHLNSDSTRYSSDYQNIGAITPTSANTTEHTVTLAPYSALILSQVPPTPPQLTIVRDNDSIQISWPSTYAGWTLSTVPTLSPQSVWRKVSLLPPPSTDGTATMTIAPQDDAAFYRLAPPQ